MLVRPIAPMSAGLLIAARLRAACVSELVGEADRCGMRSRRDMRGEAVVEADSSAANGPADPGGGAAVVVRIAEAERVAGNDGATGVQPDGLPRHAGLPQPATSLQDDRRHRRWLSSTPQSLIGRLAKKLAMLPRVHIDHARRVGASGEADLLVPTRSVNLRTGIFT